MTKRSLTAGEVAAMVGGTLLGDGDRKIAGVRSLERAGPGDLSFVTSNGLKGLLAHSAADVILATKDLAEDVDRGEKTLIVVDSPSDAMHRVVHEFATPAKPRWGIAPSATIGRGTSWEGRIAIGEGSVVGSGVRFGKNCVVGSGVFIGDAASLGENCKVGDGVTIADGVKCGNEVVLHPGAKIGGSGFRFIRSPSGEYARLPHLGSCELGDGVEVGANSTIDRGSVDDTIIGSGTKLDNLVHVAHNVRIGRDCMVLAQVGIAGSTVVEDDVNIGGQAGLSGHFVVGKGARVAAQSGVIGDVPAHAEISGYPARSHRAVLRQTAALGRLTVIVSALEKLVDASVRKE
ncbi:MAG: UDP-3-O-(3-hydroxymyristoyl)glucosamine N-acyltransferase [Gemmatimonadota bacterium]|nr:UDP-3-O-(3-hydroxymyristoyl)glucosamine N-acyltransferase [Gemmatimonadota bacterium]